jgi:hypothetical protein
VSTEVSEGSAISISKLYFKNWGSMILRNFGTHLPNYRASHPRR